jgi:hypothetical protein
VVDEKQLENVDAECTLEIKTKIIMDKETSNSKKTLFTSKSDFNVNKKPVKCCICNKALYGAETWAFRGAGES